MFDATPAATSKLAVATPLRQQHQQLAPGAQLLAAVLDRVVAGSSQRSAERVEAEAARAREQALREKCLELAATFLTSPPAPGGPVPAGPASAPVAVAGPTGPT
eukprot:5156814-Alexandrium_andersonii.AAC.1